MIYNNRTAYIQNGYRLFILYFSVGFLMFKKIFIFIFLLISGCGVPFKIRHEPREPYAITEPKLSYSRQIFNDFLKDVKPLLEGQKSKPKVYISYAWESLKTKEGIDENKKLQDRLICLQKDLEFLGIEAFLDVKFLYGEMREQMSRNIENADFVMLIGTPRLNQRATRDRLFLLPYMDKQLLPTDGNIIALVESPNFYAVYYIENGEIQEIITLPLDLSSIPWMDRSSNQGGVKEACISRKTNALMEDLFIRLKSRKFNTVSNVQFELGITIDKVHRNSKTLMPIIFKGNTETSFPAVIQNNLIRDIKDESTYYMQMSTLTNPLGIIAAICPQLIKDHRYVELVNRFERSMRLRR